MDKTELEERIKSLQDGVAFLQRQIEEAESAASKFRGNLAMTMGALEENKQWLGKISKDDQG